MSTTIERVNFSQTVEQFASSSAVTELVDADDAIGHFLAQLPGTFTYNAGTYSQLQSILMR